MQVLWFIPTHGDGRYLGTSIGGRSTDYDYLKQIAQAVDHLGYFGGLLPTGGYSMAYQAGAELSNIECFQINLLIKDYNGPACAYVATPFGAYTANSKGSRFISCDYWSGQMMLEVWKELNSGKGPIQLQMTHSDEDTIAEIESILWSNERSSRGRFHKGRGENYHTHEIEMTDQNDEEWFCHVNGILIRPTDQQR